MNNAPPTTRKVSKFRESLKCGSCYIRGSDAELKACARCRIARYCSRECQTAHWKVHKVVCKRNLEHAAQIAELDTSGIVSKFLPRGVTLVELDQRLEKWIKFHKLTLMDATIHALALPRDITRSRTHIVKVMVRPRLGHNGVAGKFFRVIDATVIEISEAQKYLPPWPEGLEQVATMRKESESKGRGCMAALGVECLPLGAQFVPFGSLRDLSRMVILQNWKDILIRDVENGKKFTQFGP